MHLTQGGLLVYSTEKTVGGKYGFNFQFCGRNRARAFPVLLMAGAIWVQLKPPGERSKKYWITAFIVIGLISSILAFLQQGKHDEIVANINGRMGVLMDLVLNPPSNPQLQAILEALQKQQISLAKAPQKPQRPPSSELDKAPLQKRTNDQLRVQVIAFANKIRDFEHNFQSDEVSRSLRTLSAGTKTDEEKNRIWKAEVNTSIQRSRDYQNEFKKRFLGEAVVYRDELLRRLNIIAPEEERRIVALNGILAGPAPLSDLALYLEKLARQLP
jgi:hypothetical protein